MGAVSSVARLPMGRALSDFLPVMSEEAAAALDLPFTRVPTTFSELDVAQMRFLDSIPVDLKPQYRKNNIIVNQ